MTKLIQSRDASIRLMEDQQRARQRSTDAVSQKGGVSKSYSMTNFSGGSAEKKLAMAKTELSQLEHMYRNFNQASTLLDLQSVHKKWEEEYADASKEMRAMKTENIRRDRELAKLAKNQKDLQLHQERLRKELNSVRSRNKSLKETIEANQVKFNELVEVLENMKSHSSDYLNANTSKSVLSLELSVLQKQKENLERDLTEVKSARTAEVLEPNPVTHEATVITPVITACLVEAPAAPTTVKQDHDFYDEEAEIVAPTPEQLSPMPLESSKSVRSIGFQWDFAQDVPPAEGLASPEEERAKEDEAPRVVEPLSEDLKEQTDDAMHVSDFIVPTVKDVDPMAAISSAEEELHQLSLFVPRQLFQSSAVAENADFGPSPSPPPPVRRPSVFIVESRH